MKKNYGIELLRIISMIMVVILHVLGKNNLLWNNTIQVNSSKYFLIWLLEIACLCAVNCYALISGFVGINAKYNYKRLIYIWLQVVFYSFGIYLIFCCCGWASFKKYDILYYLFPVMHAHYWYVSAYFGLFFFIPILNTFIKNSPQFQKKVVILLLIIVFSFLPTIFCIDAFNIKYGYHVLWLMILYLIGAYIKVNDLNLKYHKIKWLLFYFLIVILTFLIKYYCHLFANYNTIKNYELFLVQYNSPFILLSSLALFMYFINLKLDNSGVIISFFSKLTFAIYIIHEHNLVRNKFIINRFCYLVDYNTFWVLINVLFIMFLISIICMIIDFLRLKLFELLHFDVYLNKFEIFLKRKFCLPNFDDV